VKWARPHLLVLCVLAAVVLSGAHHAFRTDLLDLRSGWFPRSASGEIVVVAIDTPSIQKFGFWPWPRDVHADLLEKLESAGAGEVAFDVDFSSMSNDAADRIFAEALHRGGGSVILPAFKQRTRAGERDQLHINRPIEILRDVSWMALVNVGADSDGIVRHYPYGGFIDGVFLPSMGAMLARSSEGQRAPFHIDFSIRSETIPIVSYSDVIAGDASALALLRDKRVLVGGTAIELGDRFTVPGGRIVSGPILQVLAAESILQGRELRPSAHALSLALVAGLAGLMILLWRRSLATRLSVLILLALSLEAGATLLQAKAPIIVDTSPFLVATALYLAASAFDELDIRRLVSQIADSRFNHITMALGDGVVCTDSRGLVTVWNRGAAAIFGLDSADVLGKPIDFLVRDGAGPIRLESLAQSELLAPGGTMIEVTGRRKNGGTFAAEACFSAWHGTEGIQYGIVVRDISARKREAEKIRHLAEYDTLTGLANRHTLNARLERELGSAGAKERAIGLLLIDLDTFKEVNDTLGHAAGDQVLFETASRLNKFASQTDLVARIGGDEFAVVISGDGNGIRSKAEDIAGQILSAFTHAPLELEGRDVAIRGSIGIALYPEHAGNPQGLLSNADLALYRAKAEGRQRYVCFDPKFRESLEKRVLLESELKRALEKNEFELFYQPKVALGSGAVVGAEALIRWNHPERGLLPPAEFIQVVNTSSISNQVALWVLKTAATQARTWQIGGASIRVSLNLSPSLIHSGELPQAVRRLLQDIGLSPSLLELEVTEDIVLVDEERALSTFREIQQLGVLIAFDDFGTGYASLSYLKKFPLDILKIDRSFIAELRQKRDDAAIVAATISLGKQFRLSVIAEGIEDGETASILHEMGCDEGQGYLYGKPMPAGYFERKFLSPAVAAAPPQDSAAA
jgi:diguanylate cyclase (GGDEF)-like protein/PAS domain S-box-containing protein